ncbi:MAG: metallophosphoesterase [Desulfobacteraceae bacterium]|nr:metallophosphoesterase [Desulfobacteraceae bacterium]
MRVYFFGDLHGNAYALEACMKHMDRIKPDEVYCLGDLAGWLPFGDRTLERIRAAGFPTVAGNHDLLIAGAIVDRPEQIDRMQATAYNAGLIFPVPGAIEFLLGLPLAIRSEAFTVVHHAPFVLPSGTGEPSIRCFDYLDEKALRGFIPAWRDYPDRLIFSGHDHIPAVYELPDAGDVVIHRHGARDESLRIRIEEKSRYWIKAGSVGGPYRDGIPAANSVVYDSKEETITLHRIGYDTGPLYETLASHRFCRNLPTMAKYVELLRSGKPPAEK